MIRDFGIKAGRSGIEHDKVYAKHPSDPTVWLNVRDGNSILESYNPDDYDELLSTEFIRRGLPKFFTLNHNFVSKDKRESSPPLE